MRRSTIRRAIGHAIGWLGIAAISPAGVSWAQTAAMPGIPSITESAAARQNPIAIVGGMLASPDAKTQAWGAWYAGRDVITDLIPGLIFVASQHASPGTLAQHAARDAALDALIQLRAKVPADLVARLIDDRPVHAVILASRIEDSGDTLLEFARASSNNRKHWFAAANLLLARRQPGFARLLVDALALEIDVSVSDDGLAGGGYGSGGSSIGCGGLGPPDFELPPWASYEFTTTAEPDVVVLAMGPVPVYYERRLSKSGNLPPPHSRSDDGPSSGQRLLYAAALMKIRAENLPIRAHAYHTIKWSGQRPLDEAIQSFRADARRGFDVLVRQLVTAGLVAKEEASGIEPVINLRVHDLRTEPSSPLTPLTPTTSASPVMP